MNLVKRIAELIMPNASARQVQTTYVTVSNILNVAKNRDLRIWEDSNNYYVTKSSTLEDLLIIPLDIIKSSPIVKEFFDGLGKTYNVKGYCVFFKINKLKDEH